MTTLTKPIQRMQAREVMTSDIVFIPREMSLKGAAHLLSQSHITGAPVVDSDGKCIGVISATDFMARTEKSDWCRTVERSDCAHSAWQVLDGDCSSDSVEHYMTHTPVTTGANTTLGELSRLMCELHVHRVIIVDENSRPIGIVSSMDILGALAAG